MRPFGKVRVMTSAVPLAAKAVAVVKETVTGPVPVPIAVGNADSVGRVTQPTQGVATCAATVSLLVWICRPGAAAAWAAFGATVSPVQVTVTGPAAMVLDDVNVSLIMLASAVLVDTVTEDGTGTPQAPAFCEMRPFGKVRVMTSPTLKAVAVVKETEAVPDAVVGLAGNADSVGAIGMTVV